MDKFNQAYLKVITEQNNIIQEGWLGKLATGVALGTALAAGAHNLHAQDLSNPQEIEQPMSLADEIKAHETKGDCIKLATAFIKNEEGTVRDQKTGKHKVYLDKKGVKTIGYGCTDKKVVAKGQITDKEAEEQLAKDITKTETGLKKKFGKDWDVMDQHQKAALISLYFNCGLGLYAPNLVKYIKQHDWIKASNQFLDIDNVTIEDEQTGEKTLVKVQGLTDRRAREVDKLFLYWYND